MATLSYVSNLSADLELKVQHTSTLGSHRKTLTLSEIENHLNDGQSISVPVFHNGNFAFRSVIGLQKTVNHRQVMKSGRLGKDRFAVHPDSLLLVARSMFEITSVREDKTVWLPARHLKDGIQVQVVEPPTASRIYDLSTCSISKVKQEKLKHDLVTYTLELSSTTGSVVTSTGLVLA